MTRFLQTVPPSLANNALEIGPGTLPAPTPLAEEINLNPTSELEIGIIHGVMNSVEYSGVAIKGLMGELDSASELSDEVFAHMAKRKGLDQKLEPNAAAKERAVDLFRRVNILEMAIVFGKKPEEGVYPTAVTELLQNNDYLGDRLKG